MPPANDSPYATVGELYERIKTVLIATAARTPNLFVGPLEARSLPFRSGYGGPWVPVEELAGV